MSTVTHQHTVFHAETYEQPALPPAADQPSQDIPVYEPPVMAPVIPAAAPDAGSFRPWMPVAAVSLGYALFNVSDAMIKHLAAHYHFSQIMVLHCIAIIGFMCAYGYWREGKKAFVVRHKKLVFLRAALAVIVGALNIQAFQHVALTTFYTLVFTAPFWVILLSALFLGEKLRARQAGVILFGFSVVLFMFQPGSGVLNIWSASVLLGAFLYAASMVVMRKMGPDESRTVIICAGSVLTIVVALPILPFYFIMPSLSDFMIFAAVGVIGALGLMAVAWAFQNAPAAGAVAPFHYTQIVWGTVLGFVFFNETPTLRIIVGATLIIAAGLYLLTGDMRDRKRAAKVNLQAL